VGVRVPPFAPSLAFGSFWRSRGFSCSQASPLRGSPIERESLASALPALGRDTPSLASLVLALKVGLTASASIPAAVLSMAVLRGIMGRGTILENNVVQTTASSGDSLAAGIAFTVPALLFLGYDPSGFRIFLLAATAGLLGVLMLIPLRHELTIAEHERLPFPEGTACATVLIAGDRGRAAARPVFIGIALGAAYQFVSRGFQLWNQAVFVSVASLHKLSFGAELTPLFLGVGYLVGARIAGIMLAGGLLAWMVLIPLFDTIAGTAAGSMLGLPPDLASQGAQAIWSTQVRFVGAGAVACGGVWSIARALPVMWRGIRSLVTAATQRGGPDVPRTERGPGNVRIHDRGDRVHGLCGRRLQQHGELDRPPVPGGARCHDRPARELEPRCQWRCRSARDRRLHDVRRRVIHQHRRAGAQPHRRARCGHRRPDLMGPGR